MAMMPQPDGSPIATAGGLGAKFGRIGTQFGTSDIVWTPNLPSGTFATKPIPSETVSGDRELFVAIIKTTDLAFRLAELPFAELLDPTATVTGNRKQFSVDLGSGDFDKFTGVGFVYDANGKPQAGTITSYKMIYAGETTLSITGMKLPMKVLLAAVADPSVKNIETLYKTLLAGADRFIGSDVGDVVFGYNGNDKLTGNDGADTLDGMKGNDVIDGGAGNDLLRGGEGNDKVYGRNGNDSLMGGAGNDLVDGGKGNDWIDGGAGNDTLRGGDGFDEIRGGKGKDKIAGGFGSDELAGGLGADTFIYNSIGDSKAGGINRDRILDFNRSKGDKIDLSKIDARPAKGKQSFDFIGADAFSGKAGELRFEKGVGSGTTIYGDRNGDGVADFEIFLVKQTGNPVTLTDDSFLL
jgi:serralysin